MARREISPRGREKQTNTDLLGEIVDLRDERALLEVHFSTVSLEIVDRALV